MSGLLASLLPYWETSSLPLLVCTSVVIMVVVPTLLRLVAALQVRFREARILSDFPGNPMHWFWGNLRDAKTREETLTVPVELMKKYGPIRRARLGPFTHNVIFAEPDSVKTLLSTADPKEELFYRFLRPWIGDGLLVSKGQKWARNRRLLTPAFHFEILKPYVSVYSASASVLIGKWKNELKKGPRLEMFHHISLMMLESLLKCAFNYSQDVQLEGRKNPYIEAVYGLSELVVERFRNVFHHNDFLYFFSYNGYKFRQACRTVQDYSRTVIQARREQKKQHNEPRKKYLDFLDILLEARDESGQGLTDEDIQHEVDTFMFEGHDTTASGLSWFMYNMAAHPEHQQRCHEEVMKVLGDRDEVTWQELPKLEYLTLCIKESLRTHPPVSAVARRTTKPINLKNGLTVPVGIMTSVNIFSTHHNPDLWEDPDAYNPLRFTTENSEGRSPHAFVPFSAGPRNCIGQNFAMNEMKTCGALLLKHFEFSKTEEPVRHPELVMRSKDGIWLNVTERKN